MPSSQKLFKLLNKMFCIPIKSSTESWRKLIRPDKLVTSDPECVKMLCQYVKLHFLLKNRDCMRCFTAVVCSDGVSSGCSRLLLPSRSDPAASNSLQGNSCEIHEADGECDRLVETLTYEQNVFLKAASQRFVIVTLDFFYQLKVKRKKRPQTICTDLFYLLIVQVWISSSFTTADAAVVSLWSKNGAEITKNFLVVPWS